MSKSTSADPQRGFIVAKNERGKLELVSGSGFNSSYVGSRTASNGRVVTRRFRGNRDDCIDRWLTWQRSKAYDKVEVGVTAPPDVPVSGGTDERVARPDTGGSVDMATETAKDPSKAKAKAKNISILRFVHGRSIKDVAAYASADTALAMAVALGAALEATDQDGEYDVVELPIWG